MSNVYFITDGEYIKIGVANNVTKRLYSLQTGNPKTLEVLKTIECPEGEAYRLEALLHKKFLKYCANGEWFIMGDELCQFVGCHYEGAEITEQNRMIQENTERLAILDKQIEEAERKYNEILNKEKTLMELNRKIQEKEEHLAWVNEQIEADCWQLEKIHKELERRSNEQRIWHTA